MYLLFWSAILILAFFNPAFFNPAFSKFADFYNLIIFMKRFATCKLLNSFDLISILIQKLIRNKRNLLVEFTMQVSQHNSCYPAASF